jgi:hypothetical protein
MSRHGHKDQKKQIFLNAIQPNISR